MYPQVIHVDLEPSFSDHVSENMIHEHLKSRRGIAEPEEHYGGLKEAKRSDEHCFPLVFLLDANVVVSPTNIELGEQCRVLHIIDQLRDEGERIPIVNGVGVEISVVLAQSQGSILFGYEEKRRGLWGL